MILQRIALRNFRSYEELDLRPGEKVNLILGRNGAGKTNLAEAVHFLSLARSWRTDDDRLLIKDGEQYACVEASISEGQLHRTIQIEIGKDAKRILVNGKPCRRLSELSKLTNVIAFSPSDVPLFLGSPGNRRAFLDVALSKQSSDYFALASRYARLLKERNAALKSPVINDDLVAALTAQMIEVAEPMVRYRSMYVASLNGVLPGLLARLRGEPCDCSLTYRPFVKADSSFRERAQKAFDAAYESDRIHRSTSVGPHREDLGFLFNGKNIADYGSQGENRMAVLALKLAPYFLIEEEAKKPICVLDDVTSELDTHHVRNLFEVLKDFRQCFVTATESDIEGAVIIDVAANKAIRRN